MASARPGGEPVDGQLGVVVEQLSFDGAAFGVTVRQLGLHVGQQLVQTFPLALEDADLGLLGGQPGLDGLAVVQQIGADAHGWFSLISSTMARFSRSMASRSILA